MGELAGDRQIRGRQPMATESHYHGSDDYPAAHDRGYDAVQAAWMGLPNVPKARTSPLGEAFGAEN